MHAHSHTNIYKVENFEKIRAKMIEKVLLLLHKNFQQDKEIPLKGMMN